MSTRTIYSVTKDGTILDTQRKVVTNYLVTTGEKLSHRDCEEKFGFTRLSAIIFKMKESFKKTGGRYIVRDEVRTVPNRYGKKSRVKFYWVEHIKNTE